MLTTRSKEESFATRWTYPSWFHERFPQETRCEQVGRNNYLDVERGVPRPKLENNYILPNEQFGPCS